MVTRRDLSKALSGRLRELYEASGLSSFEKFCYANDLDYRCACGWLYFEALPSHVKLVKLALHFDVTLDWLLGLD